ncbi:MAG TPA: uroporphyrinogen-III C-methyltransferase, partial [Myxococcota bacterium]|nr:uroporphyrinogen-III C-methyltransferase [Myxococcota bacterium]
ASKALLDLAPPEALRIDVGKRGHDEPTRTQEETTALLLRLAAEGRTVVRLKGGDPYVFGRGGEEASACAEAGIPFEVVPGVSAIFGALAFAGIPITDRRHGASFAVVTGHKDPTKVTRETRWDLLARAADTLVILMGMRNLAQIVGRLLDAGRSPATPSAVVMSGTLPSQRVVTAPLGELALRAERAGLGAPAVVVVGDVVSLRDALAWYEHQPLFGCRVLVTRAPEQSGDLVAALAHAGAEAVLCPLIRLAEPDDPAALDAALARLAEYHAIVFTSANAVRFTAQRAQRRGVALATGSARVVCVGPATAQAALDAGLPVHRAPPARHDAEAVLAQLIAEGDVRGQRFLVPRSDLARDVLPDGLRAAGAQVDAVVAYRNAPADVDRDWLRGELVAGRLDVLTFASPSAARRFCALLDPAARAAAARCTVAAIGPVTARALASEGLPAQVVAQSATAAGLVEELALAIAARRGDAT